MNFKKSHKCFFVSDLHGKAERYEKLIKEIKNFTPDLVFIGGDIYPPFNIITEHFTEGFFEGFFIKLFRKLKTEMEDKYPDIFIILGNDDPKPEEQFFIEAGKEKLWQYIHNKKTGFKDYDIYGFSFIPPTPFLYKDWELYDISRYVDPGCIHPTEGKRHVKPDFDIEFTTIKQQLEELTKDNNLEKSIFLFHSPPYKTNLDRAALDGIHYDHVPLDVHVGSIAIKDFIEKRTPYISLHGHIHESTRLTGFWKEKINKTWCFNAAIDTSELSVIVFNLENPQDAERRVL